MEYIEANLQDYRVAYRLAQGVLGVSLDELSRWSRELLEWLTRAQLAQSFTRRELRESLAWPDRRLREALDELVEMEFLDVLRGNFNQCLYKLSSSAGVGNSLGCGLLTPEELEKRYRP